MTPPRYNDPYYVRLTMVTLNENNSWTNAYNLRRCPCCHVVIVNRSMIKVDSQSWVIVGVKSHRLSVQLFWAPYLTHKLVLVFVQVNVKEYENELFSFNVTFVKSWSLTCITLKFLTHDCLGALYLNSRERYVGGVIPWGHHDHKSLGAT